MIQKLLFCFLVFVVLGACASTPAKNSPLGIDGGQEQSAPWPEGRKLGPIQVYFPEDLNVADDFTVEDETDAQSLVFFALKLERKHKFTEAATFFHEAADLQEMGAAASRFRLSCLGAAAVCWLKAGEEKRFHSSVSSIRAELNRFQQADLSDQLSLLMAISDKLRGRPPYVNPSLPQAVKTLFDDPRRMP